MIRLSHVVFALVGMTGLALAQSPPMPTGGPPPGAGGAENYNSIGVDAAFVLPVGDYADGVDAALGLFGRVEFGLNPQLFVTGRLGFLHHIIDQAEGGLDFSLTMVPIYGGIRYNFAPSGEGPFLAGEAGFNNIRFSASVGDVEVSDSETKVSFNIGGGFQTGKISFRGSLFFTAEVGEDANGDGTNLTGLMATIGYDFARF